MNCIVPISLANLSLPSACKVFFQGYEGGYGASAKAVHTNEKGKSITLQGRKTDSKCRTCKLTVGLGLAEFQFSYCEMKKITLNQWSSNIFFFLLPASESRKDNICHQLNFLSEKGWDHIRIRAKYELCLQHLLLF